jgi:hypothetical protein
LGVGAVALASYIGGRGFSQSEALKHNYPDEGSEGVVVEEVLVEEGSDV